MDWDVVLSVFERVESRHEVLTTSLKTNLGQRAKPASVRVRRAVSPEIRMDTSAGCRRLAFLLYVLVRMLGPPKLGSWLTRVAFMRPHHG